MKKKKTVTLPRTYSPGKGHPKETLAYLNPAEHALIKQLTDGKANRGPMGVRSYAVETGTTTNSTSGGGSTTGGGGSKGPNGGPGGGSLQAPNRTAPSAGATVNSGVVGSKTGGASTQQPGAGQNAGVADAKTVAKAAEALKNTRTTATGQVAQAAAKTAAQASGTATQWGGRSTSSPQTAPNGSYYGPKGGTSLNNDARMAAARSVGFSQPSITRTPGDAEALGRMMMAESGSIRNAKGGINTTGLQGVADVVRNRALSDRFPDTVAGVLSQKNQFSPMFDGTYARTPANDMATRVAESVLSGESPPVVGNALNYANLNTVNTLKGYSSAATKNAFNSMTPTATIADARNPNSRSHTFGTIGNNSDVSFGGPGSYSPGFSNPTQVAGIANAGLGEAAALDRAKKAAAAAAAMQNLRPMQGPNMPPQAIPAPNSIGIMPSPSVFAKDPRVGLPQGGFPASTPRSAAGTYTSPYDIQPASAPPRNAPSGMSFTPSLPGPMPAQTSVVTDPRVSLTPLGSLPAAKPKDIQVAWNVPPMGGAIPSAYGDLFGTWGVNRPQPKGPAANPGTIHSQTADAAAPAASKTSGWSWGDLYNTASAKVGEVQKQIDAAKETPAFKFAQEHPRLAEIGLKMMMGGGGNMPGNLGTAQENSDWYLKPPAPPQAPNQQTASAAPQAMDAMAALQQLQANMIAQGASPEDLAYIQSIIDELTNSQVA